VQLELLERQVQQVLKGLKEVVDQQDLAAQQVQQELKVILVIQGHKDLKDLKVILVIQDHKDLKDLKVQ
jgi:hypothetical protein